MLTLDLLRLRVTGDHVRPIFLSPTGGKYAGVATRIIAAHHACLGRTLGELEETLDDLAGGTADYKVYRGLAKIMTEYLDLTPPAQVDAEALRRQVFTLAAHRGPLARRADLLTLRTVADALAEIASAAGVTAEALPILLYADLRDQQVLAALDTTVTAPQLIARYNTALAQAMLYRATWMVLDIHDNFRTVVKYLKLSRLMHVIRPLEEGYRIILDGPASLFAHLERYGINMAGLLPAVLKGTRWHLQAMVRVGSEEKLFRLSPRDGLTSHYRDESPFDSVAEAAFFQRFSRNTKTKWTIAREGAILSAGDTVMLPDFTFRHRDGRIAHLEIVGFWTPRYLERKIAKLRVLEPPNLLLALPASLNCAADAFDGPVIHFKERLLLKDVLPRLEEVGRLPGE